MNANHKNSGYVEGDSRSRWVIFAYLGLWFLFGIIFIPAAEKKIDQINASPSPSLAESGMVFVKYIILPMSVFLMVQGLYLCRLGIRTFRSGIHPPPGSKMPFRTRITTGNKARIPAICYMFAGVCSFLIIGLLLMMLQGIFKHV